MCIYCCVNEDIVSFIHDTNPENHDHPPSLWKLVAWRLLLSKSTKMLTAHIFTNLHVHALHMYVHTQVAKVIH